MRYRIAIYGHVSRLGGQTRWVNPWFYFNKQLAVKAYLCYQALEELESLKLVELKRRGRRITLVTLASSMPKTLDLVEMSRRDRYYCAQIALWRDQDPLFGQKALDTSSLRAKLTRIYPDLLELAGEKMLSDLEQDLLLDNP